MERGERRGYDTSRPVGSFVEVVRGVIVEPARFFGGLRDPRPGDVRGPLVFAIICAAISTPLAFFLQPYGPPVARQPDLAGGFFELFRNNPGGAVALAALALVLLPLFAVLRVYVGAAIQHFFVFLFVRQRRGYWATFPVMAYGSALSLFSWIPLLGYLVALYGVYVTTIALREMHGTTTTRALLAALVPALLGLLSLVPALLNPPTGP